MKVSMKWLQEYLDLSGITADELAEKMSRTGIEVDGVGFPGKGLSKIVVGETLDVVPHENSDHLHVCQVDVGEEEPIQIVCGAPNIAKGQKVIVALHGARIADNYKIKKGKIRGEVSNGMICSLDELGYSDNVVPKKYADGIFVLPSSTEVGTDVLSVLNLDDHILELDITPNRADALSMRGVAHELAAVYDKKAHFTSLKAKDVDASDSVENYVAVAVEDATDTPAYHIQVIKDVKIQDSPLWLQTKLMNAGMRPVNNIVDITNYILLEYGQPLHAFDYDKINSKNILVRRAKDGEMIKTLDGTDRKLDQTDIVVTNGSEPIALAGVMGGFDSEITDKTTTVALEFAMFDSLSVRKTGTRFNLRSESSARFEKGINMATIKTAGEHAAQLIAELGQGQIVSGTASIDTVNTDDKKVSITLDRINGSLGTDLAFEDVEKIIHQLGFGLEGDKENFVVSIPPRRWDITIEPDIVEEVARIYGYDLLPATLPVTPAIPSELTKRQKMVRLSRAYMESAGLTQNINYVLTTKEKATAYVLDDVEPIALAWPMSEDRSVLRQNLLASLLDTASYNVARKNSDIQFYEIGKVFYPNPSEALPEEREKIAGILTGQVTKANWQTEAVAVDFYHAKGVLEGYFKKLGLADSIHYEANEMIKWMHPGRTADVYLNDQVIGYLGQVHPSVAKAQDLKDVYVFELNFEALLDKELTTITQGTIPKYPGISRDIAILVNESVTHSDIKELIKKRAGKYLVAVQLFDIYQGEGIEDGKKSMAYSLSFLNPDATLVDEDINPAVEAVKEALINELEASIR